MVVGIIKSNAEFLKIRYRYVQNSNNMENL